MSEKQLNTSSGSRHHRSMGRFSDDLVTDGSPGAPEHLNTGVEVIYEQRSSSPGKNMSEDWLIHHPEKRHYLDRDQFINESHIL